MLVVLKRNATDADIVAIAERIELVGFRAHISEGGEKTIIGAVGAEGDRSRIRELEALDCVEEVIAISRPYKIASREFRKSPTVVRVGPGQIGGKRVAVIAGPCSVEDEATMTRLADGLVELGCAMLRGGAFKPRTSPYSFQGLGEQGLRILRKVGDRTGLPIVTELVSVLDVEVVGQLADVIQIGARNAQNYDLITRAARVGKPILLKRGMAETIEEWLLAAEYVLREGNPNVILCERGIKGFDRLTRNTLDLGAVAVVKRESHLPVVVDPSHAAGHRELVPSLALASVAAGADGLLIEVHPDPQRAWTDGAQTISLEQLEDLMNRLRPVAEAVEREV